MRKTAIIGLLLCLLISLILFIRCQLNCGNIFDLETGIYYTRSLISDQPLRPAIKPFTQVSVSNFALTSHDLLLSFSKLMIIGSISSLEPPISGDLNYLKNIFNQSFIYSYSLFNSAYLHILKMPTIWLKSFITTQGVLSSFTNSSKESFALAMVLGDPKQLAFEQRHQIEIIGMSYLLSTSGFHVQLLVNSILAPVNFLVGRRLKGLLIALVAFGFVAAVGWPAAAIRTALSLTLKSWAKLWWQRSVTGWWLVIVTAGMMLLVKPAFMTDLGFQLSVLAGLGIQLISKPLRAWLKFRLLSKPTARSFWRNCQKFLVSYLLTSLTGTLGALVLSWPLIILAFQQISLLSPFSSLVLMWQVPWLVTATYISLALAWLGQVLPIPFLAFAWLSNQFLARASALFSSEIGFLAQNHWALLTISRFPIWITVVWWLVALWWAGRRWL